MSGDGAGKADGPTCGDSHGGLARTDKAYPEAALATADPEAFVGGNGLDRDGAGGDGTSSQAREVGCGSRAERLTIDDERAAVTRRRGGWRAPGRHRCWRRPVAIAPERDDAHDDEDEGDGTGRRCLLGTPPYPRPHSVEETERQQRGEPTATLHDRRRERRARAAFEKVAVGRESRWRRASPADSATRTLW